MEENKIIDALKELRLKKKMSQKDVYTKIGWKQQKLSLLESNKTVPTFGTIQTLAAAYGYTLKLVKNGK